MSSEQARQYQEQGIRAAKAGQKDQARKLLQQAARINPDDDTTWLWLASVARDTRERLLCLKKTLELNPENEMALRSLARLGIEPSQLVPSLAKPDPRATGLTGVVAAEDVDSIDTGGIPLPSLDAISGAEEQAAALVEQYKQSIQIEDTTNWTRKDKGRAGEREIVVLRMQIGAALAVFSMIVIGVLGYVIFNVPEVRLVVLGPTETPRPPTFTPTFTPSPTIGFTPTPSPTIDFTREATFTPSPTVPVFVPTGIPEFTQVPTELYLPVPVGPAVRTAVAVLDTGDYDSAFAALESARVGQGQRFTDPNPYYYEALLRARSGQAQSAFDLLDTAQASIDSLENITEENAILFQPLIHLGYAEVYFQQALDALNENSPGTAGGLFDEAVERATLALNGDPDLSRGYALIAEAYRQQEQYNDAINTLNTGLSREALATDLQLVALRGQVYMERGYELLAQGNESEAQADFHRAAYEGYYVNYVNPYNESGYQLQAESALARNDPGLAVIYTQGYILFVVDRAQRPGIDAFRLQGEARLAEGKTDLALDAFSRALERDTTDSPAVAEVLLSRAALYTQQNRFDLALNDLNRAIEIEDSLQKRALRIYAAYAAGDYEVAREDAEALLGRGLLTDSEIRLLQARMLIDEAGENDRRDYNEALDLLANVGADIPAMLLPVEDEYRAWAHLALGNLGDALNAVNEALDQVETGSRHYLRGIIRQEQEDFAGAIADFEWVLTWDQVYGYAFADDALARVREVRETAAERAAAATATAQTATAEVVTATAEAAGLATEEAETATAIFFQTQTATPTHTPTPTLSPTATPTPSITPTLTPTEEPSPTVEAEEG